MKTEIQNGTCLPPEAYIRLAKLADYQPKFRSSVYPNGRTETKKEGKK
jgi:2-iminoacetate synthase ThiH